MDIKNKLKFDKIAGFNDVKEELTAIFSWYHDKDLVRNKNLQLPTGILFHGDPGNGKTLFVREYIKAFNVPTFIINGQEDAITEIHKAFNNARKEKFAIVAIDELDKLIDDSKSIERVLQSELDGINKNGRILVLATTNHLYNIKEALKRQGRFDRIIRIGNPNQESRLSLFTHYLNKLKVNIDNIDLIHLSHACTFLSCAEIKSVVNDAYLRTKGKISTVDLESSYKRLQSGDFIKYNPLDYRNYVCAIHEAGHVITALRYPEFLEIYGVRFKPDGGIMETYPTTKDTVATIKDLICKLQISVSGALAEQLFFKHTESGISDDLNKTFKIAKDLTDTIPQKFTDYVPRYYNEYDRTDTDEHKLANERKVHKLVNKHTRLTKRYLRRHKKEIKIIADALYNKGTLSGKEIYELLNYQNKLAPVATNQLNSAVAFASKKDAK